MQRWLGLADVERGVGERLDEHLAPLRAARDRSGVVDLVERRLGGALGGDKLRHRPVVDLHVVDDVDQPHPGW